MTLEGIASNAKRKYVFPISGASGSGKTTLCLRVAGALKSRGLNAAMVMESARDSQFLHAGDRSLPMHLEVLGLHIAYEMRSLRMHDILICDRSVLDFAIYAEMRFGPQRAGIDALLYETLDITTRRHARIYAHIFVPAPYNLAGDTDAFRRGDDVLPAEMDRFIVERLRVEGFPHTRLEGEGRAEVMLEKIDAVLKATA